MAVLYIEKNENLKAINLLKEAISIFEHLGDQYSLSFSLFNLAQLLAASGSNKVAITLLNRVLEIQEKLRLPDSERTKQLISNFKQKESSFEEKGDSNGK